jgi:hypothetical protein
VPVEAADDRAAFLDAEEFGVEATYQVAGEGGASATISGIFDNPPMQSAFENADAADKRPTFCCRASDLPVEAAGDKGDTLTIGGTTRKVQLHEPDGQGMVLLWLAA